NTPSIYESLIPIITDVLVKSYMVMIFGRPVSFTLLTFHAKHENRNKQLKHGPNGNRIFYCLI
ncbi:MAG: hypothetical protein DRP46_13665, partial [Candidatus Zixiibacteriota bacterium]